MAKQMSNHTDDNNMKHLFNCIGLCHDCIIVDMDQDETERGKKKDLLYQGQSLDEHCLLDMAQKTGLFNYYVKKTTTSVVLGKQNEDGENSEMEEFKILKVFKFTSDRKCASVVVRAPDGKVYVYVKGSETAIKGMVK